MKEGLREKEEEREREREREKTKILFIAGSINIFY